jgi:nucleotide-binding universal stress UspA family protein
MSMETVLLALSRRDRNRVAELVEAVTEVVGGTETTVVVLYVFPASGFETIAADLDHEFGGSPTPDEVAARHATVRAAVDGLSAAGLETGVRGVVGDEGEEIIDATTEAGAGLVFVGGSRRSPTGKAVFGSTPQHVLLNAPCPVTYVRGPAPGN